jgi:hypothetical protein
MYVTKRPLALKKNPVPRTYETAERGIVASPLCSYQSVQWLYITRGGGGSRMRIGADDPAL